MGKIRIVIERKDVGFGFLIEHAGIYDNKKLHVDSYIGSAGLKGLKESVIRLFDGIVENDKELHKRLFEMASDESLPSSVKDMAKEEANRMSKLGL